MSNVRNYTDKEIIDRTKSLPSYKGLPSGRFIVNIRSAEDQLDAFDDKSYIFETIVGTDNAKFIGVMDCTTNPGKSILIGGFREFNSKGAFIVKTDEWYHNLWTYGLHHGKMPALLQVNDILGFRDGNKNTKSEETGEVFKGKYGINYHTNTYKFSLVGKIYKLLDNLRRYVVGGWSAGCCVVNETDEYTDNINWFKDAKETGKQKFVTAVYLKEF